VLPSAALAIGWRAASLALGVACLAIAATLQPMRAALDADVRAVSVLAALRRPFAPLAFVLRMPALRVLAITSFAYSGMQICVGTFLVTYLVERIALSPVTAGFILSCAQAAGVGGRILWGALADRLGRPGLLLGLLGFMMTAAALLVGAFTPAWPYAAIIAVSILFGGTAVAWNGITLAQLARLAPAGRAAEVTGGTFFITFGHDRAPRLQLPPPPHRQLRHRLCRGRRPHLRQRRDVRGSRAARGAAPAQSALSDQARSPALRAAAARLRRPRRA
jgi:predicted MFS family arabinose efflux permease